ncbi:MAG: hypothetical protein U1E26_03985 [Coriobacteriia bacterium]|nr:hypothetical protein [Coriobacteriia bacterium]
MTKKQRRLLIVLIILALLLAALAGYYSYYRSTQKLSFDLTGLVEQADTPIPEFLYAFNGRENDRLVRPTGILVSDGLVYVPDANASQVQVFNERGVWQRSIGGSETVTPLYIARNPKNGNLYVSDRRKRAVHMYTTEGKYLGEFDPKLPKDQLPKFETNGVQWVPLALEFGEDGTFYVTELLNGHRLLIFSPDGKFKRSVGTAAIVLQPDKAPNVFQFPNGMMVFKDELFIADSNNRRIQVFDLKGDFKRIIVTQGLPRGVAPLQPLSGDDASSTPRIVSVDTLAHDATIWSVDGKQLINFGEQGLLEGQLNYPTAVAVGSKNRIFVTDTSNGRVQVWGWPEQVAEVPFVGPPSRLLWCLVPLLLLPFLLLFRKRRFYATADFVVEMFELGEQDQLTEVRRVKWITTADQRELMEAAALPQESVDLFEVWEHSEPDAQALVDKYEIEHGEAVILSVAQRSRLLCTEDEGLTVLAVRMEIDEVDARGFLKRFKRGSSAETDATSEQ